MKVPRFGFRVPGIGSGYFNQRTRAPGSCGSGFGGFGLRHLEYRIADSRHRVFIRIPGTGFRVPGTGLHITGFRLRVPGFGYCDSDVGIRVLGSGFLVLRFGFRVPGSGFQVPGFRIRASGFGFRDSGYGFRVSGSAIRVSGFGFRVPWFGVRDLGSGVRSLPRQIDRAAGQPAFAGPTRASQPVRRERELLIDNLLVRIHSISRRALRGGTSNSIFQRPCQFLAIHAHKMAPRTT